MSESQWDDKVRAFIKKTGEDLKRAGADIKTEAERLISEVKEPGRDEKVREGLKNFSKWARKTAEEVAGVVETGVKKAETAVRSAVDAKPPTSTPSGPGDTADDRPPEPSLRHDTPIDTPAASDVTGEKPPKKSIGGKKKGAAKPKSSAAAKKPLGKKR